MQTATATGPMLFLRAADRQGLRLALTLIEPEGSEPPRVEAEGRSPEPQALVTRAGATIWRYEFSLRRGPDAGYAIDGHRIPVTTDVTGDLRVAFVSCNGQEHGDLDRPPKDRNALWAELRNADAEHPIHLLLHGGDQIYADEVSDAHPLSEGWPEDVPARLDEAQKAELRAALSDAFFRRYATQWAQVGYAETVARIPSLAMWDDHDICDGWGSLKPEALDSDVGRILFECAREAFLLFQFGCRGDERPEICRDGREKGLSWSVDLPGVGFVAPDLRSTRRPERVMDEASWHAFEGAMGRAGPGRVFVMSSVPALGPRLSIVERLMNVLPGLSKYEDDLRDQWQSYVHREEWCRFLRCLLHLHENDRTEVTVLSGEIHLATRGTMTSGAGPIHQLVASGISHPAPTPNYARALGALARLGEAPLKGHPIRLRPLPGQRRIYASERNYLMLERRNGRWQATWHLEDSGPTTPLPL